MIDREKREEQDGAVRGRAGWRSVEAVKAVLSGKVSVELSCPPPRKTLAAAYIGHEPASA